MTHSLHLDITGMHCDGCVRRVNAALSKVPGTHIDKVEVGAADLQYDIEKASPDDIVAAVNHLGFQATAVQR